MKNIYYINSFPKKRISHSNIEHLLRTNKEHSWNKHSTLSLSNINISGTKTRISLSNIKHLSNKQENKYHILK